MSLFPYSIAKHNVDVQYYRIHLYMIQIILTELLKNLVDKWKKKKNENQEPNFFGGPYNREE